MIIKKIKRLYEVWRTEGTTMVKLMVFRKVIDIFQKKLAQYPLEPDAEEIEPLTCKEIIETEFPSLIPLHIYTFTGTQKARVNIITDSINSGSLFGGVGTALIFSALLANKLNSQLRIITRTESPKIENLEKFFKLYKIDLKFELQFNFADIENLDYELDVVQNDLFITTSWWTTAATLKSIDSQQIIYLLQEDERMFYAFGDMRLKCADILQNQNIRFLINSKLLFDHLIADGFSNLNNNGRYFEPALPKTIYYPRAEPKEKHKFFFYARPNNPRNLFYLGIEVIELAILQNILDLTQWDIYFVGKDIPNIVFANGYSPIIYENLTWSEYSELIGNIDLGLSLMYTPHPSYPPLDLVASGAVVVTNKFANKQNLSLYSKNLLCAELETNALVSMLKQGVTLATDIEQRKQNYQANQFLSDWQQSFNAIIDEIENTHVSV